jgi:quercetin dioxygenase-like cupin family protein
MKIFRFDRGVGKSIDAYNSSGFVISRILHLFDEAVINCAFLEAKGTIGYHQAAIPQLFLVVQGEGWVRDESSERVSVKTGVTVFWEKGEWHASGTETDMTVIIIEGVNLDISRLTPLV